MFKTLRNGEAVAARQRLAQCGRGALLIQPPLASTTNGNGEKPAVARFAGALDRITRAPALRRSSPLANRSGSRSASAAGRALRGHLDPSTGFWLESQHDLELVAGLVGHAHFPAELERLSGADGAAGLDSVVVGVGMTAGNSMFRARGKTPGIVTSVHLIGARPALSASAGGGSKKNVVSISKGAEGPHSSAANGGSP
jgi:hypothetical protein